MNCINYIKTVTTLSTVTLFLFVSLFLIFEGCSKKNSNPVNSAANGSSQISFTLNGGTYNNQSFNITSNAASAASYVPPSNYTIGAISGNQGSTSVSILMYIPGSGTGTFPWDTTSVTTYGIALTMGNSTYASLPGSGSTTVTEYGSVGSLIKGNFSGKLIEFSGSSIDTVEVSNGSFSMVRGTDTNSQ